MFYPLLTVHSTKMEINLLLVVTIEHVKYGIQIQGNRFTLQRVIKMLCIVLHSTIHTVTKQLLVHLIKQHKFGMPLTVPYYIRFTAIVMKQFVYPLIHRDYQQPLVLWIKQLNSGMLNMDKKSQPSRVIQEKQ